MLSRLHIQKFRAFNPLKIDSLAKINLFSGRNNSGKTSLLEAIFLLSGAANPAVLLNANVLRGITVVPGLENVTQNVLWKPMFHDLNMNTPIRITAHHSSRGALEVKLSVKRPNLIELPLDNIDAVPGVIVFDFARNGEAKVSHNITVINDLMQVQTEQPNVETSFSAIILSARNKNIEEDAQRLGQLRQQKKGHLIVKALQVIEPALQGVEVNSTTGQSMIWGDIGLSELMPLPIMGDGMVQIARIVLAISSMPGGVVLIDEIENGLHHSVLPQIWKVIRETAKRFNTQIFATTHSYECIETAEDVFKSSDDDAFLLHRLDSIETETRCVTYEKETMETAIRHNMEIR